MQNYTKQSIMEVSKAYDINSQIYDAVRERSHYFKIIEGITRRAIFENIKGKDIKRICDVGCGTGRNIPTFLSIGKSVWCLDYSKGMLKKAKNKFKDYKNVKFFHGSAEKLPFKSNFFNMVASFKVLPHVKNLYKTISEMKRISKKGGLIFIELYSPYSFRKLFNQFKHYTRWDSHNTAKKTIKEIGNLKIINIYGSRTFMMAEFLANLPILRSFYCFLENKFSNSFLNKFSGYYIIVCEKI